MADFQNLVASGFGMASSFSFAWPKENEAKEKASRANCCRKYYGHPLASAIRAAMRDLFLLFCKRSPFTGLSLIFCYGCLRIAFLPPSSLIF